MADYIEQNLQPGETIDYRGHVSWVFALHRAAIVFVISIILLFAPEARLFAALLILFAIALAIGGYVQVQTWEYAVTDRRVIGKYGWLGSQSVDVLLTKVTGVAVDNTVLGRLFGYGTVVVDAAGVSRGLVAMQDPQAFVRAVYKRLEVSGTAPSARSAQVDVAASVHRPTKKCPDCAETILADAKVCKHCGYRFAPTSAPSTPPKQISAKSTKVKCHHCEHIQVVPLTQHTFACEECGTTLRRRTTEVD